MQNGGTVMPKLKEIEYTIKKSYSFKPTTLKKLQELKVYGYGKEMKKYNEILDEAISILHAQKMKE